MKYLNQIIQENGKRWAFCYLKRLQLTELVLNENGWCYIARQWEHFLTLRIKSEETGVPVDILMKEAAEKERLRQKRKREVMKAKKAAELNKDADRSEIRTTRRQRPNS